MTPEENLALSKGIEKAIKLAITDCPRKSVPAEVVACVSGTMTTLMCVGVVKSSMIEVGPGGLDKHRMSGYSIVVRYSIEKIEYKHVEPVFDL